jgi:kynurenine formamidase
MALLKHNVLIGENLTNLSEIRAQSFQLVAVPLKFTGRDSGHRGGGLVTGYANS